MKYIDIQPNLPQWLDKLVYRIHQNVPKFRRDFKNAYLDLPDGADLELIKAPFLIYVLEKALTTFKHEEHPYVAKAIQDVIALWKRVEQREVVEQVEWDRARDATEAAKRAAAEAAWATARASGAARAAGAAARELWIVSGAAGAAQEATRATAEAAAGAAGHAVLAAAEEAWAAWREFGEKLLELVRGCGR